LFFHVGAVAQCPHGAPVITTSANVQVVASNMAVALASDQFSVAGCTFVGPTGQPQPCMKVQWTTPTTKCLINNQPAITALSVGMCIAANGVPGGPVVVTTTQPKAVAT
jgi:hypothetical protein